MSDESDEALEEFLEDIESDEEEEEEEEEEWEEARRRHGRRRPRPPVHVKPVSGKINMPQRKRGTPTWPEVQIALAKVGAQLKTMSDSINKVNNRLTTLGADQSRLSSDLKKEVVSRKKETTAVKSDLSQYRAVSTLAAVAAGPKQLKLNAALSIAGAPGGQPTEIAAGDSICIVPRDDVIRKYALLAPLVWSIFTSSGRDPSKGLLGGDTMGLGALAISALLASGKLNI